MPRYTVIWEDVEDSRAGDSFNVEASTLHEAHQKAIMYLDKLSPGRNIGIIEALVDENGTRHLPQFYLRD